mmetsp:Transcript_2166/g.9851  ORF Transcript_2166/g.9851 Transcript_2166/m.9851 type:complete len:270 (+) Transcript_2166:6250-7059(+)
MIVATFRVTSGRCRSSILSRDPSKDRRLINRSISAEALSCSSLAALAASVTASGASAASPSASSSAVRSVVDALPGFVSSYDATSGMNRESEKSRVPRKTFSGDRFAVTSRSLRTCTTTNLTQALSASASISMSADVNTLISAATSADVARDAPSTGTSGGRRGADPVPSACVATCDRQLLRSCRSAARTCGSARRRWTSVVVSSAFPTPCFGFADVAGGSTRRPGSSTPSTWWRTRGSVSGAARVCDGVAETGVAGLVSIAAFLAAAA